jgi:hypothetical protein
MNVPAHKLFKVRDSESNDTLDESIKLAEQLIVHSGSCQLMLQCNKRNTKIVDVAIQR